MIVLATEKIYKDFSATLVLEAIDIQVQKGQKVGLLGPNGSGKTTLLRIIAGELEPDSEQGRSEEHTSELQLRKGCRFLLI